MGVSFYLNIFKWVAGQTEYPALSFTADPVTILVCMGSYADIFHISFCSLNNTFLHSDAYFYWTNVCWWLLELNSA